MSFDRNRGQNIEEPVETFRARNKLRKYSKKAPKSCSHPPSDAEDTPVDAPVSVPPNSGRALPSLPHICNTVPCLHSMNARLKRNYINTGGVCGVEEAEGEQQVSILRKSLLACLGSALSCPLRNDSASLLSHSRAVSQTE